MDSKKLLWAVVALLLLSVAYAATYSMKITSTANPTGPTALSPNPCVGSTSEIDDGIDLTCTISCFDEGGELLPECSAEGDYYAWFYSNDDSSIGGVYKSPNCEFYSSKDTDVFGCRLVDVSTIDSDDSDTRCLSTVNGDPSLNIPLVYSLDAYYDNYCCGDDPDEQVIQSSPGFEDGWGNRVTAGDGSVTESMWGYVERDEAYGILSEQFSNTEAAYVNSADCLTGDCFHLKVDTSIFFQQLYKHMYQLFGNPFPEGRVTVSAKFKAPEGCKLILDLYTARSTTDWTHYAVSKEGNGQWQTITITRPAGRIVSPQHLGFQFMPFPDSCSNGDVVLVDDVEFYYPDSGTGTSDAFTCLNSAECANNPNFCFFHPDSGNHRGSVYDLKPGYDILSDGSSWYLCDALVDEQFVMGPTSLMSVWGGFSRRDNHLIKRWPNRVQVFESLPGTEQPYHEYICYNDGTSDHWGECVGTEPAYNDNSAGTSHDLGQNLIGGPDMFYCAELRPTQTFWTRDLDINGLKETCNAALGDAWTGKKCCGGESPGQIPRETHEFYSDPWDDSSTDTLDPDSGGCWVGSKIKHDMRVYDQNIVKNPGLEDGMVAWNIAQGTAANVYASTIWSNTDDASLRVRASAGENAAALSDPIPLPTTPTDLRLVFFYKGDAGRQRISLVYTQDGENPNVVNLAAISQAPATRFTRAVQTLPDYNYVQIQFRSIEPSDFYYDDIRLRYDSKDVMNHEGTFYGCMWTDSDVNNGPRTVLGQAVVTKAPACNARGSYFCDNRLEEWSNENYFTSFSYDPVQGYMPLDQDGDANERTVLSDGLPGEAPADKGCCPENYCWAGDSHGSVCMPSMADKPSWEPIQSTGDNKPYRCINGTWREALPKYDWYGNETGYCPTPGQCLLDIRGEYAHNDQPSYFAESYFISQQDLNPQCIGQGQSVMDSYCELGNWTSRTKMIATAMMRIAGNRYTLFCDNYTNVLNYLEYSIGGGLAEDYVWGNRKGDTCGGSPSLDPNHPTAGDNCYACKQHDGSFMPCANNFCVLETGTQTVIGTSLNNPLNQPLYKLNDNRDYAFRNALGLGTSCSQAVIDSNDNIQFEPCTWYTDTDGNPLTWPAWYNNNTMIIIFSKQDGVALGTVSFFTIFKNMIKDPIGAIIAMLDIIQPRAGPDDAAPNLINFKVANFTKEYSRIYIDKKQGKKITGIMESAWDDTSNPKGFRTFVLLNYSGFSFNLCGPVKAYDVNRTPDTTGNYASSTYDITCDIANDGGFYVISKSKATYHGEAAVVWRDLTSKLRVG